MPEGHATLGASGSAKWLSCAGSLALEALINEPDKGSRHASEGTMAHSVLEKCLRDDLEPSSFLGRNVIVDDFDIEVTQEMVNAVEVAIEYVHRLASKNAFYEEKLDYSHIAPEGYGTGDILLEVYEKVAPKKRVNTLYVIDFKYGAGINVGAFENSQGMLYGIGALNSLDMMFEREIEKVIIVIIQPRMDNISEYAISVDDLLKWGEETVKPKAKLAYDLYQRVGVGDDVDIFDVDNFNPSKKTCQWCQGRRLKKCKTIANAGYKGAIEGFEDLTVKEQSDIPNVHVDAEDMKSPVLLDSEDLAAIYPNMCLFMSFFRELGKEIIGRIKNGERMPGLKLIPTEKPREWKLDEEDTVKAIRTSGLQKKDYVKNSIISPTEAETKLKEVKPRDHGRRYKRLAAMAIHRVPGKEKIIEDSTQTVDDIDDILG